MSRRQKAAEAAGEPTPPQLLKLPPKAEVKAVSASNASQGQERLQAPEPGTTPSPKRAFPSVRFFESSREGKQEDQDLQPERRPSWRKDPITQEEEVQVALAASLAEAENKEVPLGTTPRITTEVGSMTSEAGAAAETPTTPPNAIRNSLLDKETLVWETHNYFNELIA